MNRIRIVSLYSGSTGNAFYIASPNSSILIDAGKNAKKLCEALCEAQASPKDIQAVFITHEHSDHVSALPVFLKKYPVPVHVFSASAHRLSCEPSVAPHLFLHSQIFTEQVGDICITSFPTPHDSNGSVGYRIEIPTEDGTCFRIGYATDIGHVSTEVEAGLTGCDAVILESNHDAEMLRNGPYPYELKRRIFSANGHLANTDSAEFAAKLCAAGTKSILLAHLSQENNTPEIAYAACATAVGNTSVQILVAKPNCITEVPL